MRYIIISLTLFLITTEVRADQLAWIPLAAAERAIEYLKKEEVVVLWCACCKEDPKMTVRIRGLRIQQVSEELYQVVLRYEDNLGNEKEEELDLAYVHVRINRQWCCLGEVLDLKCEPCTLPFKIMKELW